jgi:hypothetical protein
MADCDSRQLTQAQREAAYQQQARAGVVRAIRPFSGQQTIPNIIDYLNRELYPAVRQQRAKLNDIYRPVVDNAPSGNPLTYYFSAETANADPTTGFIRFDNATQELATTIRVSETNGRLANAAPWLDVMAGGATDPLGTVTVSDLGDPTRFIRFDLNSMTDQGAYWDLGVSPIESSHDNPFVDGGPVTIGFIPGVASTPVTVPPGSVTPMSAHTLLGNPTNATAAPTEIPIAALSVPGRTNSAADIASITAAAGNTVLRCNSAFTTISFSRLVFNDLPQVLSGQFYLNATTGLASPLGRNLSALAGLGLSAILDPNYNLNVNASTSVVIDFPGTNEVQRAALTGDVTAAQNSNTTAFRSFSALSVLARAVGTTGVPTELAATPSSEAVLHEALGSIAWGQVTTGGYSDASITDAKITNRIALSVMGRASNSAGPPADISSSSGSNTVLRESGGTIGWGVVANAGLANMAAGTVKGRAVTAGTGVPTDLSGAQTASLLRFATLTDTTSSGTVLSYAPAGLAADTVGIRISPPGNLTLQGMALADGQQIAIRVGRSSAFTVTLNSEDLSATATERFNTPGNLNLVLRAGEAAIIRCTESRNNVIAVGRTSVADGDYGDITVSTNGTVWTIDNNVVSDAKLRDSAALSVIGRSANSSGDPADIAGSASSDAVLRISGTALGFGTVATAGIADDAVTNAKIRNSGALSVIGRSANSSGDPADISATAASGAVLRESGSTLGFGTIATAGITDDAVTNAKLANMAAGTTKGRFVTAGTGDPTDLTGDQQSGNLRYLVVLDTTSSGTVTSYAPTGFDAGTTYLRISPPSNLVLRGMALAAGQEITMRVGRGTASTLTINHEDASANSGEQFNCPNNVNLVLRAGESAVIRQSESRGNVISVGRSSVADADYGDITVSSNGATWTIDNDVVSDAKLRNSAALSVIGRSANSAGDPADIAAANDGEILRRSGTTLGFGTIATAGLADNSVTDAKLRDSAALSVIGRAVNSSGDPGDITAGTNDRVLVRRSNTLVFDQIVVGDIADGVITVAKLAGIGANTILGNDTAGTLTPNAIAVGTNTVLGRVAGNIVAAQLATGQIAANAVTDAKLRQSAARSVVGRTGNTTGDVADISAVSGSDNALRESGGTLTFGTLATGAYANNSVTNAKLAQAAQSTIKGRAEGAGTGDVGDLTPSQVVAIIDGEAPTWTAAHTFNGVVSMNDTVDLSGAIRFTEVLSTGSIALDDLALSGASVLRLTGSAWILTGMVPAVTGRVVLIVNAHGTDTGSILLESTSSATAANRFAGVGTSRAIKPGEMALSWYDGVDSRWRLLCRDDADL